MPCLFKALFTFFFIAFFSLQQSFAQNTQTYDARWQTVGYGGIKGGVNIATVSNLVGSGAFLGFHGGFFGEVQPLEAFGLGAEALYTKQGVTASNLDFSLDYISLPLFLNFYESKVTVQGGAYGAVLFMATAKIGQEKIDITDAFKSTDYGLLVGFKFRPSTKTFIGARFNLGLKNINHDFTELKNAVLRNRNLQISAGYQF